MSQKTKMLVSEALVPVVQKVDTSPATMALHKVELLLTEVAGQEASLDYNWVKLSVALEEVQVKEYWRGKHTSFGSYLKETCEKYKRGRSQMYNYIAVAHVLLPVMSEEQIIQVGIAKAQALTEGVKAHGSLPVAALETALDASKTVQDIKEVLFRDSNKDEKGEWFPLTGFPVSKEERATITDAFQAARRTDPAIPATWKPWQILKETLLRLSMEYLSSNPEVEIFQEDPEVTF
jgi:hypothetical protein